MEPITNILSQSKSICIVGNAQSILEKKNGDWIDSFESVIRMNRWFPKKKKFQGSKTDILALSCSIKEREYIKRFGAPPVTWMTPKRDKVPGWISPEKLAFYPEKYWQQLYEKLQQHRPSTGAMVIDLVCNYIKPETLRITGFDFKATHTLFEKKEHLGLHDWALEQDFTLSLMATAKEEGRDWLIV